MFRWLLSLFQLPEPCDHPNATETKWLDPDGTPMVTFSCPDCGAYDRGHVYADPETWLTEP